MKTTIRASIVGMKYYDLTPSEAAELLRSRPSLVREPNNRHDRNAIAVVAGTRTVGHIDRRSAAIIAPELDAACNYEIEIGEPAGQSISIKVFVVKDVPWVAAPQICGAGTAGIYKIFSGGDIYVGQSKDIQNRINQHWSELNHGIHPNPQLLRLWKEEFTHSFSAKVLERALIISSPLNLARWLHNRECHWIDAFGGLREVVNADFPKPVLDELAKRELQLEREAAGPSLKAMKHKCGELSKRHKVLCTVIDELRSVVSKSERFWGVFNSSRIETEAEAARRRISTFECEAKELIDEQIAIEGKIREIERQLFIRD